MREVVPAGELSTLFGLHGAVCLVTGGGRGIGRAIAQGLAMAGGRVVVGDVELAAAEATVREVERTGGAAQAVHMDVGSAESVARGVEEAVRYGAGLDVLVNNAGINIVKPTDALLSSEWEEVIRINLTGVFLCSQAAARAMRRRSGGRIVNVASIYGLVGSAVHAASPYAASKGGVVNLTRALAVEWAADGIRVNAIAPGYVRTSLTEERVDDPAYRALLLERIPLRRILDVTDLVGTVIYLASPASEAVTGQVLAVDGGWLAQ